MRIAVIGAGVSGLSLCHALEERLKAAGKSAEILLIEAEGRVGGKIRTHRESGYVMEWGPNGFLNNKPDTLELCLKLGIADKLLPSNDAARRRYIYSGGKLHELNPAGFVFGGLLTWHGKLRLLAEVMVPKRIDAPDESDESLADFVRRRLGAETLNKLIGPMAQGVYGGDPETMSLKSCFPTIYELEREYGGLIKGMFGKMAAARKNKGKGKAGSGPAGPGGVLTSFDGGLDVLTEALKSAFTGELLLDSPVRKVEAGPDGEGFVIHAGEGQGPIHVDVLVSASPSYAASEYLRSLDAGAAATLDEINYAPMAVMGLGYSEAEMGRPLNGFGFLVAMDEKVKLIGCLWDSSVFKGRAPEGKCSLRGMVGGGRDPETPFLPDAELTRVVRSELNTTMGIDGEPELVKIFRHEKAIPMYTIGHSGRLARLDKAEEAHRGLFFAGNAYRGVGLNDCVREANLVADKVMKVI
jgi:oxygen-dependent protoporphyrinogen oxidase